MGLLFGNRSPLQIEMVPKSAWGKNLRTSCLAATSLKTCSWDRLRRIAYQRAGNKCEICSGRGPKWPVECHEVWDYRLLERNGETVAVQRLDRLIALCPLCHSVKHMGFARVSGREREALEHLALVNGWSTPKVQEHVSAMNALFEQRSKYQWSLDLGGLLDYGVTEADALALTTIINGAAAVDFEYSEDFE